MSRQKGQSTLEFAISLPILLLLVMGTIEFGRAYYQYNTLSKAIRDGARYLSSKTYSTTEFTNAKNMVVYGNTAGTGTAVLPGLTTSQVVITPAASSATVGVPPVWFDVQINAYPFVPVAFGIVRLNASFSPQIQMRFMGANATY